MVKNNKRRLNFRKNKKLFIKAYKEHKVLFFVYIILRLLVLAVTVEQLVKGNYENVFTCALTLLLLFLPAFVERQMSVIIPDFLEIVVLLFIFSAEILGEINAYYEKIPMWDTMLHVINGFISAAVGFSMVDILNRNKNILIDMSPLFTALVAFCFSMTIGVLWEFFEFFMDRMFLTDMQKDAVVTTVSSVMLNPERLNKAAVIRNISETYVNGHRLPVEGYLDIGLYDTMKDLFVNFIGAVVFSVFGYFYARKEQHGGFIKYFLLKKRELNEDDSE